MEKEGFYALQNELIQNLEAEMFDLELGLITPSEYKTFCKMEKQVCACTEAKALMQIAQSYYRICLLRITNSEDSYVNRKATEYYLRKLQNIRRDLYV